MPTNKFWVDWSDPAYPQIRAASEVPDPSFDLKSLGQCKKDILSRARQHRKHWLLVMKATEEITESKVYGGEKQ